MIIAFNWQKFFVLTVVSMIVFNMHAVGGSVKNKPTKKQVYTVAQLVRQSPQCIKEYLAQGAAINQRDVQKNTFLHQLAKDSNSYVYYNSMDDIRKKAELFIQAGIDLTAKNKFGDTALSIAKCRIKTYELSDEQPSAKLVRILKEARAAKSSKALK